MFLRRFVVRKFSENFVENYVEFFVENVFEILNFGEFFLKIVQKRYRKIVPTFEADFEFAVVFSQKRKKTAGLPPCDDRRDASLAHVNF